MKNSKLAEDESESSVTERGSMAEEEAEEEEVVEEEEDEEEDVSVLSCLDNYELCLKYQQVEIIS